MKICEYQQFNLYDDGTDECTLRLCKDADPHFHPLCPACGALCFKNVATCDECRRMNKKIKIVRGEFLRRWS